jgi:FO synthase
VYRTEIILVGHRSTQWYSGSINPPPLLIGAQNKTNSSRASHESSELKSGPVAEVLRGVDLGQEIDQEQIVTLFGARGREVDAVAQVADRLRQSVVGDVVTWVHNRNINYTNVCTFKCQFCGFSKGPLSLNLRGTPYLLTLDDIAARASEAWNLGATEVTLQGGIHPDFDGDYYIDDKAIPIYDFLEIKIDE